MRHMRARAGAAAQGVFQENPLVGQVSDCGASLVRRNVAWPPVHVFPRSRAAGQPRPASKKMSRYSQERGRVRFCWQGSEPDGRRPRPFWKKTVCPSTTMPICPSQLRADWAQNEHPNLKVERPTLATTVPNAGPPGRWLVNSGRATRGRGGAVQNPANVFLRIETIPPLKFCTQGKMVQGPT